MQIASLSPASMERYLSGSTILLFQMLQRLDFNVYNAAMIELMPCLDNKAESSRRFDGSTVLSSLYVLSIGFARTDGQCNAWSCIDIRLG